ncbi:MAG: PA2169 family four-helix-bundle protein [Herminiimonas sp.]|nr:PA2169 family four-helix-bundle protein [Herminiimonas sp.]
MTGTDNIVATLNNLIETCKDGETGFSTCADESGEPQLQAFLSGQARRCAEAAAELQKVVVSSGGNPQAAGSPGHALHRRWTDIKSTLTGSDDEAILKECERGEELTAHSYRAALQQSLPPDVRMLVERQYQSVLQNYAQIKNLRDQSNPDNGVRSPS